MGPLFRRIGMATKRQKGRTGRPKAELLVSAEERERLERYVRGRTVSQALALRSRIVLACAQVWPSAIKATATGVDLIRWGRVRHYPWKRVSHFAVDERARWRIAYMVLWPEHEPSGVDPARSGLTTETLPSLRGISPKELVERLHRKQQEVTGRQTTDSR